jgi:Na+/H+ antiporter NhaA
LYESLWTSRLTVRLASAGLTMDLRHWIDEGLMTLFFLVAGLEARREIDVGQMREHRRLALPAIAALGGMGMSVSVYLALNAGGPGAHGWGTAMSTDTAFALGVAALVAPRRARLRVRVLTLAVIDDVVALVIIATAYTERLSLVPLAVAAGLYAALLASARMPFVGRREASALLGVAVWAALLKSGIDPVVAGLAVGLSVSARRPRRSDLEHATELARSFREQPTPAGARLALRGVSAVISPNERLQHRLHPWTSLVIVPLFALANAGIHLDAELIGRAVRSPVTLGIVAGFVVGKPLGIFGAVWLATRIWPGALPRSLSWPTIAGGGVVAGVGFTVALLISSLAFHGPQLEEGQARRAPRRRPVLAVGLGVLSRHRPASGCRSRASAQSDGGRDRRPVRRRGSRPRPHPRRGRRSCDPGRVRRLRVPILRPGGDRHSRAARVVRR